MAEKPPDKQNLPTRHNNPLNLKYGGLTRKYIDSGEAELGEKAKDGGRFLKFKTPKLGFSAAKDLLFNNFYKDLDVDSAMKKWSNQGYGSKRIAPHIKPTASMSSLSEDDKDHIVNSMAKHEGFKATEEVEEGDSELKNYKVTNNKTGETITAQFKSPPTQEEVKKIFTTRAVHKRQRELSEETERERPFLAKVADYAYAPSEAIAPEVMAPEDVEQLPTGQRLMRLGQEVGAGLTAPENFPGLAATALGPVGVAGAGLAYAPQMIKGAYESSKQLVEHPSLETGVRAAVGVGGAALAGLGVRQGMKSFDPTSGRLAIKSPPVQAPPKFQSRAPMSRQLEQNIPIDAEFVEPTSNRMPGRPQAQITGDVPYTEDGAVKAPTSSIPEQRQLSQAPRPKQITGEVTGEPFVMPPSSIEGELGTDQITGRGLGQTKQLDPYYRGTLIKKNSDVLLKKRGESTGKVREAIDDILRKRGILRDQSEVFPLEKPVEPEMLEQGYDSDEAYDSKGNRIQIPNKSINKPIEGLKKENIPDINPEKVIEVQKPPSKEEISKSPDKIENTWLREQDTSVLQNLLPGSRGQMAREINAVLQERGVFSPEKIIEVGKSGEKTSSKIETDAEIEKIAGKPIDELTASEMKEAIDNLETQTPESEEIPESTKNITYKERPSRTGKDEHIVLVDGKFNSSYPTYEQAQAKIKALGGKSELTVNKPVSEKPLTLEEQLRQSIKSKGKGKIKEEVIEKGTLPEEISINKQIKLTPEESNFVDWALEPMSDVWTTKEGAFDREGKIYDENSLPTHNKGVLTLSDAAEINSDLHYRLTEQAIEMAKEAGTDVDKRVLESIKRKLEKAGITGESSIKEEPPKIDEAAFSKYNQQLEELIPQDRVDAQTLRDLAEMGKHAGLDLDTVVQDLIDNMPRVNNATNRAYQAVNKVFRKGEAGFGTIDFFTRRAIKKAVGTEAEEPINQAREQINIWEKYWTRPERVIGRMGESGQKLEEMLEEAQYQADQLKGQVDILAHDAFKDLTPREAGQRIAILKDGKEVPLSKGNMDKYVDWDNGTFKPKPGVQRIVRSKGSLSDVMLDNTTPMNPKVANAANLFKQAMEILAQEGENSGVSIIGPGGRRIPFNKLGYEAWPRDYTDGFFRSLESDPANWTKLAKDMAADKGITVEEAREFLKNKKIYTQITSRGKLQKTFKQDSFVIDPESVYNHIDQFSGRIAMAKAFGPEDISGSLVKDELIKLQNEGWDKNFASDTISRLVGREGRKDIPVKGEATIYKAITDLNNLRLMTSFVINNLGGATTMMARVGPVNTFKGLAAYLGNMEVARRLATLSGARKGGIIERGGNATGRILGIPMSERFIRTWADQSGRVTANQLVSYLSNEKMKPSSPQYIRAKKLFDSILGKDTTETIMRGEITPEEASRSGWQLAKDTQGLINPATFPDVWQQATNNVFINLAMQYKRMAAQSMGSLMESYRLNPARALSAIFVTGPIIGELIGDTGSALFGALAGAYTGEGATKGAIRNVQERGKSLSDAAKPLLQKKFGLSDSHAKMFSRYIDNMNRGFALGLLGDLIYGTAYIGKKAAGDIIAGGIGPAYEFAYDISKAIMDDAEDILVGVPSNRTGKGDIKNTVYNLLPQRVGSSLKSSEKAMKGTGGPTVRAPRLP